jgi:hypothetical protein
MKRKIDRMYCEELAAPQPGDATFAPFRESAIVASGRAGREYRTVSREKIESKA